MYKLSLLALALTLTACNGKDEDSGGPATDDTDTTPAGVTDNDNDGYYAEEDDCNDDNAAVNPTASESCDGIDNNCDGLIDDSNSVDALEYYPDADTDGYGDENAPATLACAAPSGYVSANTDCDDSDPAYNPGAAETDCEDPNDYNCDGSVGFLDGDGDGFAACEDCNDDNVDINPDAEEVCGNAQDDDCDLLVDDDDPEPGVGSTTWYIDYDGDGFGADNIEYNDVACDQPSGYVDNADDCNDLRADANPDTLEVCDEIDNNCDGAIDENSSVDAETWYYDGDADGFGDPSIIQLACVEPPDYQADNTDCDDSDFDVNPDALELCATAGTDDDCDTLVDEGTAEDAVEYYYDGDGDSYGITGTTQYACSLPANYAEVSGDCADSNASRNPGEDEVCDGIDNNCDGDEDESTAIDADIYYADTDGDGYGDISVTEPGCTTPVNFVSDATDCEDSDSSINPGEPEICNDEIDNNCDTTYDNCEIDLTAADTVYLGEAPSHGAGNAISYAGDIDGDGVGEILIAANGAEFSGETLGAVYMFYGPLSDSGNVSLSTADAVIVGDTTGDKIGKTVSGGDDIDGDGLSDFILSTAAPNEICDTTSCDSAGSAESGATYVFYDALTGSQDVTAADAAFIGEGSFDRAGVSAIIGDMDGATGAEIAIGANANDDAGSSAGIIYVLTAPVSGLNNLDDADAKLTGEAAGDKVGQDITSAGDVNGDGFSDLLTGTVDAYSDVGAAYIVYGPVSGTSSLSDADVILVGEDASDGAGNAIAAAGDVDGDGNDDVLIGAPGDDEGASNAGAVYLVYGPGTTGDLSTAGNKFIGPSTNWGLGTGASGNGDVDGDGELDLIVSASGGGAIDEGEAYLFFGPITSGVTYEVEDADATFAGDATGDAVGASVVLTGDVDGSGNASILLGASGDDDSGTDAGAAYLILGIGL